MATNNHIAQLKSRLDQAIIQRDHWKQLAARKNMLVIVDVDPESRSIIEHIVTEDHVRAMWKRMESLASQRDKLAGLLRVIRRASDKRCVAFYADIDAVLAEVNK